MVWAGTQAEQANLNQGRSAGARGCDRGRAGMTDTLTNAETGQEMRKRSVFRVIDQDRRTMASWFASPGAMSSRRWRSSSSGRNAV
ncbi:hypothetical protein CKO40_20070 [Halochromatium glycolicum]|uniref:Uncharacterized protein n=1 Tax=Halochromatium glycolicum TaxID=85075 RepID=A0AAJ0XBF6_9GAMM|nr:hypothetical protein [Halochromatium glycolicum]